MILEKDIKVLNIDGTLFHHNVGPSPRFVFDPNAIVGWSDGVDIRRSETERPISAGDFADPGRLASRMVTITGTAIANDFTGLHHMRDIFIGLLSDGGYSEIALATGLDVRYTLAGLGGQSSWIQQTDTAASWKMDLYMPDPRLYSEWHTGQLYSEEDASNQLTYPITYPIIFGDVAQEVDKDIQKAGMQNLGNSPSYPVFKVTGNYPGGFTIANPQTGQRVSYHGVVTSSAPITIDFATGAATMNGVDRSYELGQREWFSIPPNSTIRPHFIPNQSSIEGFCDVLWRSTWV